MENLMAGYKSDSLNEILQTVHFKSTVFCESQLSAPWGWSVTGNDYASFHVVIQGKCFVEIEGAHDQVEVSAGEMLILPHGQSHVLRDDPGSPVVNLYEYLAKNPLNDQRNVHYGGGGALTSLLCGGFHFEDRSTNPLLSLLPPFIHVRSENGTAASWLRITLEFLSVEVSAQQPGADTVINRLADILFIETVRAHFSGSTEANPSLLGALKDRHISQVLALIHREPEGPWTVTSLASRVGMSRTTFATRFSLLVGESPLRYVTRCRMNKAIGLLNQSHSAKLAQIAELVGYDSEVAFSKAFKRHVGVAPGAFRRSSKRKPWADDTS